jgi:hypothetical protein
LTEEKALKLFARLYNKCDFSGIVRHLHPKATYESWDNFYKYTGRSSVAGVLGAKACSLREINPRNKAYIGFTMVKHDIIGTRCEPCLVLTRDDPRQVIGVVRIKCSWRRIRRIRIYDGKGMTYTRGDYAGD